MRAQGISLIQLKFTRNTVRNRLETTQLHLKLTEGQAAETWKLKSKNVCEKELSHMVKVQCV